MHFKKIFKSHIRVFAVVVCRDQFCVPFVDCSTQNCTENFSAFIIGCGLPVDGPAFMIVNVNVNDIKMNGRLKFAEVARCSQS